MEVKIKDKDGYVEADWTIEDSILVVSPKKVKFEPKDGDVLFVKSSCDNIIIYKEDVSYVGRYANFRNYGNLYTGNDVVCSKDLVKEIRYATEEEKKLLFDKLAEKGFEWKADTKELVKLKWKPKKGEPYFSPIFSYIDFLFSACSHIYTGHFTDEMTIKKMRAFRTKDECQLFCDKLNQTIEEYEP